MPSLRFTYRACYDRHMSTDLNDAIALLRKKRAEAMALVEKYDQALHLLAELDSDTAGLAVQATAPGTTGARLPGQRPRVRRPMPHGARFQPSPRSVKSRVLALLDESSRAWTTPGILEEFERRGDPLAAKDVGNAVRTALSEAVKEGAVVRMGVGVYIAQKYSDGAERNLRPLLSDEGGSRY